MNEESKEAKQRGTKNSQQGLYAKFEPLADPAIEKLKTLLESRNENIALGAVKLILERTIPAKKALELTGQNGEPIKFIIDAAGYNPTFSGSYTSTTSSNISDTGSTQIQGAGVASESKEDINSNNGNSQTGNPS